MFRVVWQGEAVTLTNWSGNTEFRATRLHRPTSLDELQRLVAATPRVRALGSAHSFNDVADTPGELVRLDRMPYRIEIDGAAARVRVGASTTYARLAAAAARPGVSPGQPGLAAAHLGGRVRRDRHARSGPGNQSLSAAVSALELVTADGSLITLDRGDADFPGAVVSLGALGIVTTLTLDLVPAFELRQYVREGVPDDAPFDELMGDGHSVSLFTDWHDTRAWIKRRTSPCPTADWHGTRRGGRAPAPGAGDAAGQLHRAARRAGAVARAAAALPRRLPAEQRGRRAADGVPHGPRARGRRAARAAGRAGPDRGRCCRSPRSVRSPPTTSG